MVFLKNSMPITMKTSISLSIMSKLISVLLITLFLISGCKKNKDTTDINDTSDKSYTQSGGTVSKSNQNYVSDTDNSSAVKITDSGDFSLTNSTITSTGNTSSEGYSNYYGFNACVLATTGSKVTLTGCKIITTGTGANGVFSSSSGTVVNLVNDTISCSEAGSHGVEATYGGTINLNNVIINTNGERGAAITSYIGGGTIVVSGGKATSTGSNAPGIYCIGTIAVSGAEITSTKSEGVIVEGTNSVTLTNSTLTSSKGTRNDGIMIFQSGSGDATGKEGTFSMKGGTYNWNSTGPAFYVTNDTGNINLKGVTINTNSSVLFKAAADEWGTNGANGGNMVISADSIALTGDVVADKYSTIQLTLKNGATLNGAIDNSHVASSVKLTLDTNSIWNVSADSYISVLYDTASISDTSISNIYGNGHTVYYNTNLNSALGGKTYTLNGGGTLVPTTDSIN
jgi:hypothetical protein